MDEDAKEEEEYELEEREKKIKLYNQFIFRFSPPPYRVICTYTLQI